MLKHALIRLCYREAQTIFETGIQTSPKNKKSFWGKWLTRQFELRDMPLPQWERFYELWRMVCSIRNYRKGKRKIEPFLNAWYGPIPFYKLFKYRIAIIRSKKAIKPVKKIRLKKRAA